MMQTIASLYLRGTVQHVRNGGTPKGCSLKIGIEFISILVMQSRLIMSDHMHCTDMSSEYSRNFVIDPGLEVFIYGKFCQNGKSLKS